RRTPQLRHAFITAGLDAGVPLRDVQEAASHADPRTNMRYDRARVSLDWHATYIVATLVAGATRQQRRHATARVTAPERAIWRVSHRHLENAATFRSARREHCELVARRVGT